MGYQRAFETIHPLFSLATGWRHFNNDCTDDEEAYIRLAWFTGISPSQIISVDSYYDGSDIVFPYQPDDTFSYGGATWRVHSNHFRREYLLHNLEDCYLLCPNHYYKEFEVAFTRIYWHWAEVVSYDFDSGTSFFIPPFALLSSKTLTTYRRA